MKKELAVSLNKYLADVAVLYVKSHNLHWNVIGRQFKTVHEYLEVIYDGFADVLDEVAEALKMNGEMPLASMKDYLAVSSIEELASVEVSVDEVLASIKGDIAQMKATSEAARKLADEEDAYDIVSMLEGHLSNYNKTLWFLEAMTKA